VVDVPRSAQVALAVDDHDVVVAKPVELDCRTNSPEARTHNHNVKPMHAHKLAFRRYSGRRHLGVRAAVNELFE
jgi:hypothetical protein